MAQALDAQAVLYENLLDAGCDEKLTTRIMVLLDMGQTEQGLALLSKHRKSVLDSCHAEQKKIDCLDYLVYQLRKEQKQSI